MEILCGLSHGNETVFLAGTMNSPEPSFSPGKPESQLEGEAGFRRCDLSCRFFSIHNISIIV